MLPYRVLASHSTGVGRHSGASSRLSSGSVLELGSVPLCSIARSTSGLGPHTSLLHRGKLSGMPYEFRDGDPRELRLASRRGAWTQTSSTSFQRCQNPFHRSLSSAKAAPACLRRSHSRRGFQSLMSEFSRQHESRSLALENRRPARFPSSCTRISRSSRAVFIEPFARPGKLACGFERWGTDATNSFNFAFDKQILRQDDRLPQRLGVYYGALGRDLALSSALIRRNKSPVLRDSGDG